MRHLNLVQTNDLVKIEMFEIELLDYLTVCKQVTDIQLNWLWHMVNTWNCVLKNE